MSRDAYYEMCEALGSEPVFEEIPVEYEDLYIDVQEALSIYNKLRDEWDYMNGNYIGKNYAGILDIFTILEIPAEDRKMLFELIGTIDRHRKKSIDDSKPKSSK